LRTFRNGEIKTFAVLRVRDCINSLRLFPQGDAGQPERYRYGVQLSRQCQDFINSLRRMNADFLFKDATILGNDSQGVFILRTLFEIFEEHYVHSTKNTLLRNKIIPTDWHTRLCKASATGKFRLICDYLAGMTDDYARMTFDRSIEVAL
jgi:dGTP triphosphohydrolase